MVIGAVDHSVTQKRRLQAERREREKSNCSASQTESEEPHTHDVVERHPDVIFSSESDDDKDSLWQPPRFAPTPKPKSDRCRLQLPTVALCADRYGVPDRQAAALVSATLHDVGYGDRSKVVDRSKVRRARNELRNEKVTERREQLERKVLRGLYFDGRKDRTLSLVKVGGIAKKQVTNDEHITLLEEPGSHYLSHFTPPCGTAVAIKSGIFDFFIDNDVSLENLVAVGCDATVVNTGQIGGVVHLIESELQRPVQWLVCMLHINELPLRHLFLHLDGASTGPRSFSGPLGKVLRDCERLPIAVFESIDFNRSLDLSDVRDELSTDQKYLWDICQSISEGHCSMSLAHRSPGNLNLSRWLTLANRILRLYVATSNPSENLFVLAKYVLTVYAPIWFETKYMSNCSDGPRHFYSLVRKSRYLSPQLRGIVDPVLRRNAYNAHQENILIAMVSDSQDHIRSLGYRRILKGRETSEHAPRAFHVPRINLSAGSYHELIDWTTETRRFSPPALAMIPDIRIRELANESSPDDLLEYLQYPCHTQSVERGVKVTTEAAASVCGDSRRMALISTKIASRNKMPKFDTKRDFNQ